MKNIKFLVGIFLIFTAFTFTSCDIEPIDPNINLDDFENPVNGPAVFKADFNGETWNSSAVQAIVSGNLISIGAAKGDGSAFSILVSGSTPGTYPANANIVAYTPAGSEFGYWSVNLENENEDTGSVIITSIDMTNHTISGTFSFKGYWSDSSTPGILPVNFTNGVFTNIPFTGTPPPPGDDTFTAKVDGTEFMEDQIDVALIEDSTPNPIPNQISIVGAKNNDDSVGLNIQQQLGVGTYTITGMLSDDDVVWGQVLINDVLYTSESGSVTIVSKTGGRISGTFSMVCRNLTTDTVKTITDGAFDVELP